MFSMVHEARRRLSRLSRGRGDILRGEVRGTNKFVAVALALRRGEDAVLTAAE